MNLIESIETAKRLICSGRGLGKDTRPIEETVKVLEDRLKWDIQSLPLSELAKRSIAIEIYSELLGRGLWLCSNKEMASQIKHDDPGAVFYTVDELNTSLQTATFTR